MFWITLIIIASFYLLLNRHKSQSTAKNLKFGAKRGDKMLLVTAHPDDECMFFTPTILYLTQMGVDVHILCLSNGDYDGLGEERAYELYRSCENFGITLGQVSISSHFQDDPIALWDDVEVADVIRRQVDKHEIDFVITFDSYGVSGHRNHISCFNGVRRLKEKMGPSRKLRFYSLNSVNVLRKYLQVVDLIPSILMTSLQGDSTLVLASPAGYYTGYKSMLCHESQLVWFRRLFVIFSRYMFVNDFVEV